VTQGLAAYSSSTFFILVFLGKKSWGFHKGNFQVQHFFILFFLSTNDWDFLGLFARILKNLHKKCERGSRDINARAAKPRTLGCPDTSSFEILKTWANTSCSEISSLISCLNSYSTFKNWDPLNKSWLSSNFIKG